MSVKHWADIAAERIMREKGDKDSYVLASGITPSGVVHFGNFREVITVDFVARALRKLGKNVRFIFSWDDYDTFRKVPKNMPKQEELEKCLFSPIVDTPDPYGEHESYAAHHEANFEAQLDKVGIKVEPLYQAKKYRAGEYNQEIIKTLKNKDKIATILNEYRKEPLAANWLPVLVYCESCNKDRVENLSFDGEKNLSYECTLCQHKGTIDLTSTDRAKLPWRVDWPMRWAHEKVDFEPGGKDHSSEGGSFTTAKEIVKTVYDWTPPVYLQYDFVSIKGAGGKMSSSSGNVITVNDVLNVYEPEMVRWIFASYKSNVDFAVSFDLDVIKTYEDFDRMERYAFKAEPASEKKVAMAERVYELSQISEAPKELPFQPSFRHLCNVLQINDGNIDKAREFYADEIKSTRDERRFLERSQRALYWIENYAPEDFKFKIVDNPVRPEMSAELTKFVSGLKSTLEKDWNTFETDKDLHEKMYDLIKENEIEPKDAFEVLYRVLIGKDRGPKLAGFIQSIGQERVVAILQKIS